jgi:uncharacterized protein (DUF1015 family)
MEISPFKGICYNQRIIGDVAELICPPYDVITSEQQKLYYRSSDYNVIRLEFPEPTGGDRYEKAAITFQQWLKQGILYQDSVSSFYLHDHQFEYSGKEMIRRGLIACVRLEPWGNGIYPHEETSAKAKSDRLRLMRACRATFSPLFSLYHDCERKVAPILSCVVQEKPLVSLGAKRSNVSGFNEAHVLWAITDPETKLKLSRLLSSQPLYIADGHHRYETALTYQQERTQCQSDGCKLTTEAFNYVMMELVEFSDQGLVVLPLHRLVGGIAPSALVGLADQLGKFFALEAISLKADGLEGLGLPTGACLGVLGLQSGSLVVLKRRQDIAFEAMMPGNRSQAYRDFGVSILNHVVLDNILGGAKNLDIAYNVDLKEAEQQIREGKYQLAFLLHPPQPKMVKAVADARDRMPRKSTYFYPKLPAGLIINPLD